MRRAQRVGGTFLDCDRSFPRRYFDAYFMLPSTKTRFPERGSTGGTRMRISRLAQNLFRSGCTISYSIRRALYVVLYRRYGRSERKLTMKIHQFTKPHLTKQNFLDHQPSSRDNLHHPFCFIDFKDQNPLLSWLDRRMTEHESRRNPPRATEPSLPLPVTIAASESKSERACIASFPSGVPSALRRRHPGTSHADSSTAPPPRPPKFLFPDAAPPTGSPSASSRPNARRSSKNGTTLLLGKDDTCLYVGSVERDSQLCVGLYDTHTHTLKLLPAYLATLQQSVIACRGRTGNNDNDNDATEGGMAPPNNPATTSSLPVSKRTLVEDFGSVKKQRALKSQEANRVDVSNVVGSSLSEFLVRTNPEVVAASTTTTAIAAAASDADNATTTTTPTAVEIATREWRKTFLPPVDATTSDPLHVYHMEKFAGEAAWRYVSKQAGILLRSSNRQQMLEEADYLPSLRTVLQQLVSSSSSSSSPETLYCIKCAILAQHLAQLYLKLHKRRFIPSLQDQMRPQYFDVVLEVASVFLNSFTTTTISPARADALREGHVMSKANVDKCRMHILLLSLVAHQCHNFSLEGIAQDLKLDLRDATHLLRLAGCTHVKRRGTLTVDLKAPVTFPDAGKRMIRR